MLYKKRDYLKKNSVFMAEPPETNKPQQAANFGTTAPDAPSWVLPSLPPPQAPLLLFSKGAPSMPASMPSCPPPMPNGPRSVPLGGNLLPDPTSPPNGSMSDFTPGTQLVRPHLMPPEGLQGKLMQGERVNLPPPPPPPQAAQYGR